MSSSVTDFDTREFFHIKLENANTVLRYSLSIHLFNWGYRRCCTSTNAESKGHLKFATLSLKISFTYICAVIWICLICVTSQWPLKSAKSIQMCLKMGILIQYWRIGTNYSNWPNYAKLALWMLDNR